MPSLILLIKFPLDPAGFKSEGEEWGTTEKFENIQFFCTGILLL